LPDVDAVSDEGELMTWMQYMEMLIGDLKWLLELPHYHFWSIVVYCPPLSQEVLQSFIIRAPKFYDVHYEVYQSHEIIWPIYKEIYALIFRVFMRLATYKESKVRLKSWNSL